MTAKLSPAQLNFLGYLELYPKGEWAPLDCCGTFATACSLDKRRLIDLEPISEKEGWKVRMR